MEISEATERLRAELDARGIEWVDASEEHGEFDFYHMERTRFCARGGDFSCIWGYTRNIGGLHMGLTYGWPLVLECMSDLIPGDPEPMRVMEVVAMADGGDAS